MKRPKRSSPAIGADSTLSAEPDADRAALAVGRKLPARQVALDDARGALAALEILVDVAGRNVLAQRTTPVGSPNISAIVPKEQHNGPGYGILETGAGCGSAIPRATSMSGHSSARE